MASAFYISHPQVRIEPAVPVPRWTLSEIGIARLQTLSDAAWIKTLTITHASQETKAVDTANALARIAGCTVVIHHDMGENDRASTGFLLPQEFEAAADAFFATPSTSIRGWERAIDAQSRIVRAVERVLATHDESHPIAFVGHGAVGTLLYCHLAGAPIDRRFDQPMGGGNAHVFDLATRRIILPWTPLEYVDRALAVK